jgi:hypothetical protein
MSLISVNKDIENVRTRTALQRLGKALSVDSYLVVAGLTLNDLTGNRLVVTNADKTLVSVTDLSSWVKDGTGIDIVDNGDGTVNVGCTITQYTDVQALAAVAGEFLALDQTTEQHVMNGAPHFDGGVEIKAEQKLYFDGA